MTTSTTTLIEFETTTDPATGSTIYTEAGKAANAAFAAEMSRLFPPERMRELTALEYKKPGAGSPVWRAECQAAREAAMLSVADHPGTVRVYQYPDVHGHRPTATH